MEKTCYNCKYSSLNTNGEWGGCRNKVGLCDLNHNKWQPVTTKQYRLIRDLNPQALVDAGCCAGGVMRYYEFWKTKGLPAQRYIVKNGNVSGRFSEYLHAKEGRLQWYIDNGFVEEVKPEVTYRLGQKFRRKSNDDTYMIVITASPKVCGLINLDTGTAWNCDRNCEVVAIENITEKEFEKMTGNSANFEPIN